MSWLAVPSGLSGLLVLSVTLLTVAQQTCIAQDPPETILLDPVAVASLASRAAEPGMARWLSSLRRQADAALTAGPFTVTTKEMLPPSGDRHDYLSLSSYAWPNPKTADGLPWIYRDGVRNPETWDYDVTTFKAVIRTVATLVVAWRATGEASYAERAAVLTRVFFLAPDTRMNPHLTYAQFVPGKAEGTCYGIIDSVPLVADHFLDALLLLRAAPGWTAADHQGMVEWMAAYLDWLQTSVLGREEARGRNNHGTGYDLLCAGLATFVGHTELARTILREIGPRRIARQIQPDGRQPEELRRTKALGYCAKNLNYLLQLGQLGERLGIDVSGYRSADGRGIRVAVDWLLPYWLGEQVWQHQQITAYDAMRSVLALRWSGLAYAEPAFEQAIARLQPGPSADDRHQHLLDLLWPAMPDPVTHLPVPSPCP